MNSGTLLDLSAAFADLGAALGSPDAAHEDRLTRDTGRLERMISFMKANPTAANLARMVRTAGAVAAELAALRGTPRGLGSARARGTAAYDAALLLELEYANAANRVVLRRSGASRSGVKPRGLGLAPGEHEDPEHPATVITADGWRRAKSMDDFRDDRRVARDYGYYRFYLLHGRNADDRRKVEILQRNLDARGFNQWGVTYWPLARSFYMQLVQLRGVRPEWDE